MMQDFTNYNQQQSDNTNGYFHNPTEVTPGTEEKPVEIDDIQPTEPAKDNSSAPEHNNDLAANPEAALTSTGLGQEFANYIDLTKKLLEHTRKERNNLIIRIDEEEDKITARKRANASSGHVGYMEDNYGYTDYNELREMRNELYRKNDLINALLSVIRILK